MRACHRDAARKEAAEFMTATIQARWSVMPHYWVWGMAEVARKSVSSNSSDAMLPEAVATKGGGEP